jgi:hypothetical protein
MSRGNDEIIGGRDRHRDLGGKPGDGVVCVLFWFRPSTRGSTVSALGCGVVGVVELSCGCGAWQVSRISISVRRTCVLLSARGIVVTWRWIVQGMDNIMSRGNDEIIGGRDRRCDLGGKAGDGVVCVLFWFRSSTRGSIGSGPVLVLCTICRMRVGTRCLARAVSRVLGHGYQGMQWAFC